jgi:hypothetical protein
MEEGTDSAGHSVITPMGRVLLRRFLKEKHAFTGSAPGNITLPRGTIKNPEYEESLESGVLTLTE